MNATVAERKESEVTRPVPERRVVVPEYRIHSDDSGYRVLAEMPGVDQSDLEIQLESRLLTITGKTTTPFFEGFENVYNEFSSYDYAASFKLAEDINSDAIEAKLINGMLEVRLPKAEERVPKNIKVTSS